jgi:hypothetical protein
MGSMVEVKLWGRGWLSLYMYSTRIGKTVTCGSPKEKAIPMVSATHGHYGYGMAGNGDDIDDAL